MIVIASKDLPARLAVLPEIPLAKVELREIEPTPDGWRQFELVEPPAESRETKVVAPSETKRKRNKR